MRIWFREFDRWWYCQVGDRQIKLAKGKRNKAEANRRFKQVKIPPKPVHLRKVTIAAIRDAFLESSAVNHDPETTDWFRRFLGQFCDTFGHLRPEAIKGDELTKWLNAEKRIKNGKKPKNGPQGYRVIHWTSSTKNAAARCVTQPFHWAAREKLLIENPLKDFKKPSMRRRQRILTPDERRSVLAAARDREFKMYLFALGNTGARPGEIRKVTAAQFRLPGIWLFDEHKTDDDGEPRVVFLPPPMAKLCQKLARKHPEGPLFRMASGKPWTRGSVRSRLRTIRRKLKLEAGVCAYAYRHTWITDGLVAGEDIHTMATLAGHKNTKMIETHYSKLSRMVDHMRQVATRVARTQARDTSPKIHRDPAA
jgi:site-specific recombinase XerD